MQGGQVTDIRQGGKITDIRQTGGRYSVFISTLPEPILIPAELFSRYQLCKGTMVTAAQLTQLRHESALMECDNQVARYLGNREHSVHEIRLKLIQKSFSREICDKVIDRYIKDGLLDDAHYAVAYIRRTIERNPGGRSYHIARLQKKGIDRTLAEKTVDTFLGETDEIITATEALRRRWPKLRQFDIERAQQKAYTYLAGRGFSYAVARSAFDNMQKESKEDEDN